MTPEPRVPDPAATLGGELRPLTARSIVLSVLLGSHPPQMTVGPLIEFTSLFGIAPGTARTALSRMVTNGELQSSDGVYRLHGRLLARQSEQDTGRAGPPPGWDGTWWFATVTADRRSVAERRDFRSRVTGARLGELRPDCWMRPANIEIPLDLPDVVITRGPLLAGHADQLTASLWNLDALDQEARRHRMQITDAIDRLATGPADEYLPDAFTTLAAAQRFLRTEPQLPETLAPSDDAARLRRAYDGGVGTFQRELADFFARVR